MRKFYTTFLLALVCLSCAWAQQDTIKVSTAKELSDALEKNADKSNAVIQLMADIDVAQYEDFKQVDFSGSLTGYYEHTENGKTETIYHAIKNLKTSLFDDMNGAKVSGIILLDGERGDKFYGGLNACFLCEDAKDCEFTDIIIANCHYKDSSFGGDWYASKTGLLTNTMDHCNVTNVGLLHSSILTDGSEIGGITGVATNQCKFKDCTVDAYSSFYTTKEPNAYIGGLVGTSEDCTFENCQNQGVVSASLMSDNLGGISGSSTKCSFTDCYNSGTVTQIPSESYSIIWTETETYYAVNLAAHATAGGYLSRWKDIADKRFGSQKGYSIQADAKYGWGGLMLSALAIVMTVYQIAEKIYYANAPDEVGGITSASYACTFERCTNEGFIVCRDAYCGGIVGYADTQDGTITHINNCINTGYIYGGEQTGGIVGYLKDSHATNCFNAGAVDCLKGTKGPIYGDTNAKGATITTCFALVHGAKYEGNAIGGEGVIVKFSPEDAMSGRAAYEMNLMVGKDVFRQTVGEDRYPNFTGDVVKASDIRSDADLTYYVTDASTFCAALMDPYAQIELKNDIDFNNKYFSLYRGSFKFHGSIDGKGHTIKNIKTEATKQNENFDEDNERSAMIQFAEGATIKNLTLDNLTVKRFVYTSGLVGNSKNCTYDHVKLKNSEIYSEATYVGGLVYESDHDTFTRCETDMKTNISTHGIYGNWLVNLKNAYAGGLAGKAKGSTFTDCTNWADVSGKMDVVGGIVSYDEGSTFTRCRNYGYISHASWAIPDDDELGGIVAEAKNSKFYECINAGVLYCEDENGGGIVGLGTNVTIINCVNTEQNLKFSENTCGGIIGYAENSMIANCASLADLPCIGESTGTNLASGNNYRVKIGNDRSNRWEAAVDEKTMKSGLVCRWLNNGYENRSEGKMVWYQNLKELPKDFVPYPTSDGHPEVLITDLPHDVITSADQLVAFAKKVNGGDNYACAVLDADIDLSKVGDWTPIGNHENRFQGVFDGQGHTIHNMKVNINSKGDGAGLFGVAHTGAEIRNVFIADDCEINNSDTGGAAGILGRVNVGWAWANVFIENCGSYAKVSGKRHAGGILGHVTTNTDFSRNVKVMVNKCYNMGNIYASDGNSGLLCGYAQNSGYFTNCWSAGSLNKMNENNPIAYSSNSGQNEFFAGFEDKIHVSNCYSAIDITKSQIGPRAIQNGVQKLSFSALTNGELTYRLNGCKTEGDLDWYQTIGEDAHPMFSSRGGDVVYAYLLEDHNQYYTNDATKSAFRYFGPLRMLKDQSLALLDGDSQKSLTNLINEYEVGRAELGRSFTANVPSTVVLPFSGEIDSENGGKFFGFSAMNYDEENNKYTAVMDEVEGGKFDAYTPYLALFAEDADNLVFENVTLKPVTPAVTQKDEWYFIGATNYKVLGLDDEISQYYYGYAGMAFDGFKLGEFARLGDGASIAPFRCYMRHIASEDAPDSFDVITRKAPTRAQSGVGDLFNKALPQKLDVILKGANGETGIATFDNETGEFRFEGWYDLNGNRVEENYNGVRVANGKKVMIKE